MKQLLVSLIISLPFCGQAQTIPFTLRGEVKNWTGTDTVLLFYMENGVNKTDTVLARNGVFSFSGTLPEPVEASLYVRKDFNKKPDSKKFYLEKGRIVVRAVDSLKNGTITAGPLNRDYERLKQQTDPLFNRMVEMQIKAMRTKPEDRKSAEFKELDITFQATRDTIRQRVMAFIKAHPASFVSLVGVKDLAGTAIDYPTIAPLFEQLQEEVKATPTGRDLARRLALARTTGMGAVLPNFTSFDTTGQSLSLNEVVKSGKVTLVDFWASWCKPCRQENPNVVKAYNAFHDKGFNIISVSLDDKAANWKYAIHKDGMPWYHASSLKGWQEPVAVMYDIQGVPDSFLLDAEGRVVGRGLRGEALYKAVAEQVEKN